MFRKAFTLMEINLAIMVMAGGLLSSVALFSYGYRESMHSNEDVASAAYAEEVMGRMVLALGDTNITWSAFNSLRDYPSSNRWGDYFDSNGYVISSPTGKAQGVYTTVMGVTSGSGVPTGWPSEPQFNGTDSNSKLAVGLVVTHDENSPVVKIAFRAARKASMLMSAPVYFTEVVFHGGDQ